MNVLNAVFAIWSSDLGIDLGTANTLVHVQGRGVVLNEPSVVAVGRRTGEVLAVGREAREMLGRTPTDIIAVRPLRDGVIADFERTEQMIRFFIAAAYERSWHVSAPRVLVGIPSGVTEIERRAVLDAARAAGAREAHLIEEPMAAAIGAGLPIQSAAGCMVVDVGGGTTEVAIISLGGTVVSESVRVGGDEMNNAIAAYVRRHLTLVIGERTSEEIKIAMGAAFPLPEPRAFTVRGRDLVSGLPRTAEMTSEHVREALCPVLVEISSSVKRALHAAPAEVLAGIAERGIVLCGGGALLSGLDELLAHETLMPVCVAEDPLSCVARGTGMVLERLDSMSRVLVRPERLRALRH